MRSFFLLCLTLLFSINLAFADIQANFTTSPSSGRAPIWITLDASSSTPSRGAIIDSYRWEVNDGRELLGQSFQTTYFDIPGDYAITLTVIDTNGAASSTSKTVRISSTGGVDPNEPTTTPSFPTAHFTVSSASGNVPLSITFNASGSIPSDGATGIIRYQWNVNPSLGVAIPSTSTSPIIQAEFTQANTYTVTLRVTDNLGRTSTIDDQAIITALPSSNTPVTPLPINPPIASFIAAPVAGTRTIQLNASNSKAIAGKDIKAYQWSVIEDTRYNHSTNEPVSSITFEQDGIYTISLTVTDTGEVNSTPVQQTFEVSLPLPIANFTTNIIPNTKTVNLDASQSQILTGREIAEYQWFVEGSERYNHVTLSQNTFIQFDTEGTYTITLVVVDQEGQVSEPFQQAIEVLSNTLDVDFSIQWLAPFKARLISNINAPQGVARYQWLGNLEINADTPVVDIDFPQAGIYSITLVVSDNVGNRAEKTHVIDTVGYPDLGKGWTLLPVSDRDSNNNLNTFFRGGVMDLETGEFLISANETHTIKQGKQVSIVAEATIDATHQNQKADVLVVVGYQAEGQENFDFYVKTENTFIFPVFERLVGDFTSIKAARSDIRLLSTLEIPVYEGRLPYVSGNYMIFIGYRLRENNTVVYNGNHIIQFQVVP